MASLREKALKRVMDNGDDVTENNIAISMTDIEDAPFREKAIVELLDSGEDLTEENISAIVERLRPKAKKGLSAIKQALEILQGFIGSKGDPRIVSPTTNPSDSIDLIRAEPEVDQIQMGGLEVGDIIKENEKADLEVIRDAAGNIVEALAINKDFNVIEQDQDTPERRNSTGRLFGQAPAQAVRTRFTKFKGIRDQSGELVAWECLNSEVFSKEGGGLKGG